ncbi:MAG: PASTA domain-containing protein [Mariniphaga sp.]
MKAEKKAGKTTSSPVFNRLTVLFYLFTCVALSCFSGQAGAGTVYQPDLVIVPQYVGMQVEQAVSRMPNDRLSRGEINEVFSDAPPGTVTGQFPEPEMRVDPGTSVNLEVSLGPPPARRIEVPNVTGVNIRQAEAVLREAGLQVGNISERVSDERDGIVLEQSPQSGTVVMENSGVDLVVSISDFRVTVPDVISLPREKAIRLLKENRLNHNFHYKHYKNSKQPENTVVAQDPAPGTRVNEGTAVFLTLARQEQFSLWFYFGGIILAAFSGGFIGYRLKNAKLRKSRLSEQKTVIAFKPVWEAGRQIVNIHRNQSAKYPLQFKYIQDSGSSTIL